VIVHHVKNKIMTQNIDIQEIVTMLKILPKQYDTPTIKVAKGKNKLPTTIKEVIKKFKNG
jgi:hypothetical protein